ncbi:glycoside hydrolase family 16 protein [Pseudocercospora fijiensis CIRAD86]|uniref:Crh-like protein n=1 Tax=Pseudocercospora fijiensis (strain CIRAD86) TaxID=383855 RepID=N1Q890_PSEFD|nr:glycoside hydrolase family 16 protein [Pseudocercospora fijiensis CIRAD86]EME88016.1 glycoside hydrolase family 16 protein [Pseudocercospora fijiensis CIRAD86]
MRFSNAAAAVVAASLPIALAQTFTDCDPTNTTCPADTGLPSTSYTADFTQGSSANASWSGAAYTTVEYGDKGAVFTIEKSGQAPTIQTDFYIFFGRVDVTMKAAAGTGIVSSIVLESDDLDEIDWEFIGGDSGHVQSNFYGKGNTTSYDRVIYHKVSDVQNTWHTYSVDWTKDKLDFLIDGSVVRTLKYSDPLAVYGKNYPQTPMQLKLGNWAGGDSANNGTVEWAGGKTDFSQGPFNMYVKKVEITNYNPACSYKYGDKSGSYESIEIISTGESCSAASASATGSATASDTAKTTATVAPTSSHSVENIAQTDKSVLSTVTGSAYSTNSASISALNSGLPTGTGATAPTQVPNPSAGINGTAGTGSGFVPAPTSSPESSTGGAAIHSVLTIVSLLSVLLGFWML